LNQINPYNDLPLLPPTVEVETKAVLRKAIAANRALGRAEGRGGFDSESGRSD
jgi:cell filamentation protein, protein adenylyltransferase